jgi:XTP/dITP diphosphohydrolase
MPQLLLATNNVHKIAEFRALLNNCGWELVAPADIGLQLEVEESGGTYAENASLKAIAFAKASRLRALADDSGLEVDALGGEPGLHAARFAGPGATDQQRRQLLLARLSDVSPDQRSARFRAVLAIATPDGEVAFSEGVLEGRIAEAERGKHGFGYDPIFELPETGKTLAELTAEEKNRISHRGLAAQGACRWLQEQAKALATA